MAIDLSALAALANRQNQMLNPYAGQTVGQAYQNAGQAYDYVNRANMGAAQAGFGNWLAGQTAAGVEPTRMQVASRVAPFNPGEALDIMWASQGGRTGGLTANAALKDQNAAQALGIGQKMDELGKVVFKKKQAGQDYQQDYLDMQALQSQYIRYAGKPYTSAIQTVLKQIGIDTGFDIQRDRMGQDATQFASKQAQDKTEFAAKRYDAFASYVREKASQGLTSGNTVTRRMQDMLTLFEDAAKGGPDGKGNAQSALITMKSLIQNIDNSVVMPGEMQQAGARDFFNQIRSWFDKWFGSGSGFTAKDLSNGWDSFMIQANHYNDLIDRSAKNYKDEIAAEYSRKGTYLTDDDVKALNTTVDSAFGGLKVDTSVAKPAFQDLVDVRMPDGSTKTEGLLGDTIKPGAKYMHNGKEYVISVSRKGVASIVDEAGRIYKVLDKGTLEEVK